MRREQNALGVLPRRDAHSPRDALPSCDALPSDGAVQPRGSVERLIGNLTGVIVVWGWGRAASVFGLGAVLLAAVTVQAVAISQSWGAWYWVPSSVSAMVVCLLATVGRHRPLRPAVAALAVAALAILVTRMADSDLPSEPSPALALGLAVLVESAVRVLSPVWASAMASGGLAAIVTGLLTAGPPSSGGTAVTTLGGLAWVAAVGTGLALRRLDVRARANVEQVRRAERLELARELHDVVAHHITGIVLQAQGAQVIARRDPEQVTEPLSEIEVAGTQALAAMRRVVGLLRDADDAAPAFPGPEQLGALVERFRQQGPQVLLRLPDADPDADSDAAWPPEMTSTVYRIVQEALTNVLRHAPKARSVTVTVDHDPHGVTVEVTDDAPPTTARPHHRNGYGLIGMRERVETLGGTLHAGPQPGVGWSVRAALPVPPAREPR